MWNFVYFGECARVCARGPGWFGQGSGDLCAPAFQRRGLEPRARSNGGGRGPRGFGQGSGSLCAPACTREGRRAPACTCPARGRSPLRFCVVATGICPCGSCVCICLCHYCFLCCRRWWGALAAPLFLCVHDCCCVCLWLGTLHEACACVCFPAWRARTHQLGFTALAHAQDKGHGIF